MDFNANFITGAGSLIKLRCAPTKNFIGLFVRDEKESTQFSLKQGNFPFYYFYLKLQRCYPVLWSLYFSLSSL